MVVLLHSLSVCEFKTSGGGDADSGTRTNMCFRTVLLSRVNCLGYAYYPQQKPLSLQTSLAAELASCMPGKINEFKFMF